MSETLIPSGYQSVQDDKGYAMRTGAKAIVLIGCVVTSRLLRHRRSSSRTSPSARPMPTGLEHLTDRELHRAWAHTTRTLASMPDLGRRLAIVITRQHLLDELTARGWAEADGRHQATTPA